MTRDTLFYSNVFFFAMITFWKRLPIFSLLRKLLFWIKYSSSFRIYHVPSFTHGTIPQREKEKSFPFLYIFLLRHLTHCCLWQNKKQRCFQTDNFVFEPGIQIFQTRSRALPVLFIWFARLAYIGWHHFRCRHFSI